MGGFRGDDRAAEEARLLGEALTGLRRQAGLSQAEAGSRAGMTGQAWGLYESGKRPGLFRPDVQRRLTQALGSGPEGLVRGSPISPTTDQRARGSDPAPSPHVDARPMLGHVTLTDDALDPWAASGTLVEYDPSRFPRRGQGCVVEHGDGSVSVWLFDGADAETLRLRGGIRGLNDVTPLDRREVRAVSAVVARRD